MYWLAFIFAFLSVCLGYALALWVGQRNKSAQAEQEEAVAPTEVERLESAAATEQARELLLQLRELTASVDDDMDRHAHRVTEITGSLSSNSNADATAVLAAAAQLIEANKQLQTDLTFAKAELRVQRQQLDSYMAEARTDALTGLGNRRAFNEEISRRFAQFQRHGTPMSLALIDVDHFKQFNDSHGHQAGDCMLQAVADVLTHNVREMDVLVRYGGEEFAVILPGTTLRSGRSAAVRLRTAVADHRVTFSDSDVELAVTVSIGLAEARPGEGAERLIRRADEALYAAKDVGRNCCYLHNGERCEPIPENPQESADGLPRHVRIAPYVDGRFLEWDMFRDVDCQEYSPAGFSYLLPEQPDYDQVFVTSADDAGRSYTSAYVESYTNVGTDEEPLFLVRCRFTVQKESDRSETADAQQPESDQAEPVEACATSVSSQSRSA